MPHPIVIAAGMAIAIGAGYVIYTELNRKSDEEEAYHTYCATIRAEKESRNRRLQNLKDPELHSEQQSSSTSKNIHHTSLRHRSTNQGELDYPLIDLGQQIYPPKPCSHRSESSLASSSSSKLDLNRLCMFNPILHIPIPDPVIFISPSLNESVAVEESASAGLHEVSIEGQEQDQSMDITDEQAPLIDWKPQEESPTLGQLLDLDTQGSPAIEETSLQELEQTEYFEHSQRSQTESHQDCQVLPQDCPLPSQASPQPSSDLPLTQNPTETTVASDSDDWSIADDPAHSTIDSPSLDENWSDIGPESFEPI